MIEKEITNDQRIEQGNERSGLAISQFTFGLLKNAVQYSMTNQLVGKFANPNTAPAAFLSSGRPTKGIMLKTALSGITKHSTRKNVRQNGFRIATLTDITSDEQSQVEMTYIN